MKKLKGVGVFLFLAAILIGVVAVGCYRKSADNEKTMSDASSITAEKFDPDELIGSAQIAGSRITGRVLIDGKSASGQKAELGVWMCHIYVGEGQECCTRKYLTNSGKLLPADGGSTFTLGAGGRFNESAHTENGCVLRHVYLKVTYKNKDYWTWKHWQPCDCENWANFDVNFETKSTPPNPNPPPNDPPCPNGYYRPHPGEPCIKIENGNIH